MNFTNVLWDVKHEAQSPKLHHFVTWIKTKWGRGKQSLPSDWVKCLSKNWTTLSCKTICLTRKSWILNKCFINEGRLLSVGRNRHLNFWAMIKNFRLHLTVWEFSTLVRLLLFSCLKSSFPPSRISMLELFVSVWTNVISVLFGVQRKTSFGSRPRDGSDTVERAVNREVSLSLNVCKTFWQYLILFPFPRSNKTKRRMSLTYRQTDRYSR